MNKDLAFAFYFVSLFFASLFAGIIVHELFHVLTMVNAHSITLHFSSVTGKFISVCCLIANETANEVTAYLLQTISTAVYFILGFYIIEGKFK